MLLLILDYVKYAMIQFYGLIMKEMHAFNEMIKKIFMKLQINVESAVKAMK